MQPALRRPSSPAMCAVAGHNEENCRHPAGGEPGAAPMSRLTGRRRELEIGKCRQRQMVRVVGLEPTLLSEPDFESGSDYSKILDYIEFSRDFALVC